MGVRPITAKAAKSCATNTMAKQTGEIVKGSKYSKADVIIGTAGDQNIFGSEEGHRTAGTAGSEGTSGGPLPSYREAWDADLEGIKSKYASYQDYVKDMQGIKPGDARDVAREAARDKAAQGTSGTEGTEGKQVSKTSPDYEEVDGMTVYNMRRDARREKVAERMANQAARQAARLRKRENRLNDRKKYEKAARIGKKAARRETREKKMQERLDQFDVQRAQGSFGSRGYRTLKVGEDVKAFKARQEGYKNTDRTYGTDITDLERAGDFVGKTGKNTLDFVKKGIKQIYGTRN